jgi:S1-C subfamily serine protease
LAKEPGSEISIKIVRDGNEENLSVVLGERKPRDYAVTPSSGLRQKSLVVCVGLRVLIPSPRLLKKSGYEDLSGVVVQSVRAGGPAAEAGIKPQVLIDKVGRKSISTAREFWKEFSKEAKENGSVLRHVYENNFGRFVIVKMPEE